LEQAHGATEGRVLSPAIMHDLRHHYML
jgi:hypothetical protein